MTINNFEEFKNFLQTESSSIEKIESQISRVGASDIAQYVVKILQEEDRNVEVPQWLQEMQQFWMNEKGHLNLIDSQGAEDVTAIAANSLRQNNIERTLDLSFESLKTDKEIEISAINDLPDRIDNFKQYLKSFSIEEKLPLILQQFCQYISLLSQEDNKKKITDSLVEFPPSRALASSNICIGGTASRMQEKVREIVFPRHSKPLINSYVLALKQGAESLLPLMKHHGNDIHLEPFLEYCLGFKSKTSIKDQNYGVPRMDILPNNLWAVYEQFQISLKENLTEQYKNYNGAISLFCEYENIDDLVEKAGDGDVLALEKYKYLKEQIKDLGFKDEDVLISSKGGWNWDMIVTKLEELQEKDFNKFISDVNIEGAGLIVDNSQDEGNMSDSSAGSDSSQIDEPLSPALLKIKAKDFAKDLLSDDLKKQEDSLKALWFLSYLGNKNCSHTLFMEAIYELGERYYKRQKKAGNFDNLYEKDHFENAKIFLKSIKKNIPEEQRFRIDDIAGIQDSMAAIDLDHFKIHAFAVSCQHKNDYLTDRNGYFPINSEQEFDQLKIFMLEIALSQGFDNLFGKIISDYPDLMNRTYYDNNSQDHGRDILHIVVNSGHKKLVKKLLDLGADINIKNSLNGRTTLSYAAENGDLRMVKMLSSADVNLSDNRNNTPLHYAVKNGHVEIVKELMKRRTNLDNFTVEFSDQVDVDTQDKIKYILQRETDIFNVVKDGDSDLFEELVSELDENDNINYQDKFGKTLTYYAAATGNVKILQRLIDDFSCDVNSDDSPLTMAASAGHMDAVIYLVENGSNVDQFDFLQRTSLYSAIKNHHIKIVEFLLCNGADNNNLDVFHKSFKDFIIESDYMEELVLVMEHGAFDFDEFTEEKNSRIINDETKSLLQNTSKLFSAVRDQDLQAAEIAINNGALVTAKDHNYLLTALDLAKQDDGDDFVKALEALINNKRKYNGAEEQENIKRVRNDDQDIPISSPVGHRFDSPNLEEMILKPLAPPPVRRR